MARPFALFIALLCSISASQAAQILVSNTNTVGAALRDYSEAEVALTYSIATTQITGMRFWFQSGLAGTTTATLRDGDGNNTGAVVGVPVRTDGGFTLYEFPFGGALAARSQYYAGYDFKNSGTAVGIGTTSIATIAFDATMLADANYAYLVPDPTVESSSTFGQFPRFEVIGVPEPSLATTVLAGLAWGGSSMWLRRKR